MTGRKRLCEKCGKRRVDLFGAMITVELDFSELCCCDVTPEFAATATSGPVVVCKKCYKRIQDDEPDSTIQWIFRTSLCNCEAPDPFQINAAMVEELVQRLVHQTKRRERASKDEPEIQVEKRKFPIEAFKPLKQIDSVRGRVFKCRDRELGTLVAVRMLRTPQPKQLADLEQEAEAISQLDHENILKVLSFGVLREIYPFMVTEYADGETLRSVMDKSRRIHIYTTVNIIAQICKGLSHAHTKEVFHWNLTPNNILLKTNSEGSPVVKL